MEDKDYRVGFGLDTFNFLTIYFGESCLTINHTKMKYYYFDKEQFKEEPKWFFGFTK